MTTPKSSSLRTTFLFTLMCWVWGSTWLAIRFGLEGVPPFVGAGLRMAISGVLLIAAAFLMRTQWPRTKTYAIHIVIQGVLLFGCQFALVYWSEQTVPSGLVAVLFAATPLVTSLLTTVVLRMEQLSTINVLGLACGFCGVAVIFWSEVVSAAHAPADGAIAVLVAAVCASVASVCAKRLAANVPAIATVGPGQLIGSVVLGVLALATERSEPVVFTQTATLAIIYLIVLGNGVAFLAYFTLMHVMPVTRLNLLTYITPIIAVLLGVFFAGEHIAMTTILGAAIVFAGIGLVHVKPPATVKSTA
ncbi:MAG TPA: EamA family transporter [Candidatus Eremiobacteraceae bacterium]|nr:EamA family transporter [Candidatus Eremiobacteraceae bacterium]